MADAEGWLPRLLRHERIIILLCLSVLCALAWAYLLTGAGMRAMVPGPGTGSAMSMAMPMPMQDARPQPGAAEAFVLTLAMWWVMMVAMMLPSAAPAIFLYARVRRHAAATLSAALPAHAALFAAGYLLCWFGFSIAAASLQAGLTSWNVVDPMMLWLRDPRAAGLLLIAVGVYQLSPLKTACLSHCRAPTLFFTQHWRSGVWGTLQLGLRHGAYCVGCCWGLMALLFVGGIMNMLWVVGLAIAVLAEKLLPFGQWIGRTIGAGLIAAGAVGLFS